MKIINGAYITAKDVNTAWITAFDDLFNSAYSNKSGSLDSRDGAVVSEILNAVIVVEDPTRNIVKASVRNLPMRYAIGELMWYMSGSSKLSAIQNITSGWDRMSDDGKTVNSNYGWCIRNKFGFDQWEYIKELLKKDPNSRQAVIHIKEPRNTLESPTKDLNCTCTLQFILRDGKLNLTSYMRSNDVWMGLPYDMFAFTCFQMKMAMELDCKIGTYTHIAGSLHLYERDYQSAIKNLQSLGIDGENK